MEQKTQAVYNHTTLYSPRRPEKNDKKEHPRVLFFL